MKMNKPRKRKKNVEVTSSIASKEMGDSCFKKYYTLKKYVNVF